MAKETKGSETKPAFLKLDELSKKISQQCRIDEKAVRRALRATMTAVGQAIEEGGRTRVQGLGTFNRAPTKEDGKFRILFRPHEKEKGKGAGKGAAAEDDD
ncbi:MAG: HU family DNA-binding protein [Rhizomicrobium sp.]|jgi:hypothetical protein